MLKAEVEPGTVECSPLPVAERPFLEPERQEIVRVLVMGSPWGVNSTIRTLYLLGFAHINDWSPLLPAPNSGDVMSILKRRIGREPRI
ncbi:hypothetical protein IQ249_12245 [Lusitaniella coriacea LEGE 07157]|uniref:Uncharacterized protein n=1 Tax=Lusitaniella coriacea LEGE 07157 TaxID=945747 RepID=A0A8J7IT82_9CYAN|nr:hypothetical protein [Lusitaniella coriacea]MBE9116672.1 hypothetical protein [Lusitaniella coriacea LEGE 07157]